MSFNVPIQNIEIEKSEDNNSTTSRKIIIGGWASTSALDFQGEEVDPLGIDDSYFKENGWIDWEHDKDEIIGTPTANCFTDAEKGLYVEAVLFADNPHVQKMLQITDNLDKVGSDRKLGFSIEGKAVERDYIDSHIIRGVLITGVAVTARPANPEATWDYLQKSIAKSNSNIMEAGYGTSPDTQVDGAALRPESLAGSIVNLSYALNGLTDEELRKLGIKVGSLLDSRPDTPNGTGMVFLQVFKGLSKEDALKALED